MKRYDEMTSTPEAVWFSSIPSTWRATKIRELFSERNTKVSDKDYPALSVGKMGIVPQLDTAVKTDNGDNRKLICKGDFAINSRSDRKGAGGISDFDGSCSLIITVLKPHKELNSRFYHYLLRSHYFSEEYYRNGKGLVSDLWTTKWDTMQNIYIPVPPSSEQDQIVRYLDWQTSRINKLIKGYKRQIELLEERKQTIIDQYSTQGIDKTVKFKKSGTHWLSEIPEHWNMVYSKQLFAQRKDKAFSDDIQLTASQKYGILSQDEFMKLEGRRVTVVMTGNDILKHVGKGDFVISMRSFQGGLEYSRTEGKISSAYVMLIPNREKVCDDYFRWLLKSTPYIKALQGTADLVRDGQALRYANFAKISLPEIPLNEQKEIAERIQTETEKIDNAIPIFEKQIALLQEYRTRLISDVVTGQIDVRDIDIPEYVSEEEYNDDLQDNNNDMEGDINE